MNSLATGAIIVVALVGMAAALFLVLAVLGKWIGDLFSRKARPAERWTAQSALGIAPYPSSVAPSSSKYARLADKYEWRSFRYELDSVERELAGLRYNELFAPVSRAQARFAALLSWDEPKNGIAVADAMTLLSDVADPRFHGLQPLAIADLTLPPLPPLPSEDRGAIGKDLTDRHGRLRDALAQRRAEIDAEIARDRERAEVIAEGVRRGNSTAMGILITIALAKHPLPTILRKPARSAVDVKRRMAICEIEVPDWSQVEIVAKRGKSASARWLPVAKKARRQAIENLMASLCIRAAYLAAESDVGGNFDVVVVNARQRWTDAATGAVREGIIASMQASKDEVRNLKLADVVPWACFQRLKGIITPSVEEGAPVRPIFTLDANDNRVVENRDVAADLAGDANLASMPWEDFEHLVRQVFEWEFGRNGVEVRVTRASRDRGVDAIMFDPDPLRGGKYVLQAKRYTRTVDVAAVRELYGTVVNEGASRGIIITTSGFGPDSYEFAKDKPLSLVDGPNLLAMLHRHGRSFRIDLEEGRRAASRDSTAGA